MSGKDKARQGKKRPRPAAPAAEGGDKSKGNGKAGPASRGPPKRQRPDEEEFLKRCRILWNTIREKSTKADDRKRALAEIMTVIGDKMLALVMKHDMSRVAQTILKHGDAAQRNEVFKQLKPQVLELSKAKYGHQLVQRLLKYGSVATRSTILAALRGHFRRLVTHNYGVLVVEDGWSRCWSPSQKWQVISELYGGELAGIEVPAPAAAGAGAAAAAAGANGSRSVQAILASRPDKAESIEQSLASIVQKLADKALLSVTVSHRILLDLLRVGGPKAAAAVMPLAREAVVALLGSKDGGRAACLLYGYGSAKDRKVMLRKLNEHLDEVISHDQGHVLVMKALDCTDDTKLVHKLLIKPLMEDMEAFAQLATHQFARKVLLFLLAPRDSHYVSPSDVDMLTPLAAPAEAKEGEGAAAGAAAPALAPTSLKDPPVRQQQLLAPSKQFMRDTCLAFTQQLTTDRWGALFVQEVCRRIDEDGQVRRAVVGLLTANASDGAMAPTELIEHPVYQMLLKRLVMAEDAPVEAAEPQQDGVVVIPATPAAPAASEPFVSVLVMDALEGGLFEPALGSSRGCFLVASLLRCEKSGASARIRAALQPQLAGLEDRATVSHQCKGLHALLEDLKSKGGKEAGKKAAKKAGKKAGKKGGRK